MHRQPLSPSGPPSTTTNPRHNPLVSYLDRLYDSISPARRATKQWQAEYAAHFAEYQAANEARASRLVQRDHEYATARAECNRPPTYNMSTETLEQGVALDRLSTHGSVGAR